jgi:hypothetical protein
MPALPGMSATEKLQMLPIFIISLCQHRWHGGLPRKYPQVVENQKASQTQCRMPIRAVISTEGRNLMFQNYPDPMLGLRSLPSVAMTKWTIFVLLLCQPRWQGRLLGIPQHSCFFC